MIKHIDYKPEDGKLIRIEAEIIRDIIKNIKITGDFFMYPEEKINLIENLLKGKNILKGNSIINSIDKAIKKNNINIIGFNSSDILFALMQDRRLKIGIAQMDMVLADKNANLKKIKQFVLKASKKNCDLICFPEYFTTGSVPVEFSKLAETIPGKTTKLLCDFAKKNNISIIGSIIEKSKNKFYNASIYIDSDGKIICKNRKNNLFLLEGVYVENSTDDNIINANYGAAGMMVCYDAVFPEVARSLSLKGAKIIFVPANWPDPFLHQWKLATSARALDNQIWVVAVNRCGSDGQFQYFGKSRVIDPYGKTIAECGKDECLAIAEIDLKKANEFKQKVNFLKDLKQFKKKS